MNSTMTPLSAIDRDLTPGWPNSAIIGLVALVLSIVTFPIGYMVEKWWVRDGEALRFPRFPQATVLLTNGRLSQMFLAVMIWP